MDIYGEFKQEYYDEMLRLAGDKPIALAEVGAMPTLDVLARQPRWAYFMMWSENDSTRQNALDQVNAVYHAPQALNSRRSAAGGADGGDPASHGPAQTAARLRPTGDARRNRGGKGSAGAAGCGPGQAVLSGQENDSSSPAASTAAVAAETGKQPAIYAAESWWCGGRRGKRVVKEALAAHAKPRCGEPELASGPPHRRRGGQWQIR